MKRTFFLRILPAIFWISAFVAIPIWCSLGPSHWDLDVYSRALHSLRTGHDPYLVGTARQENLHKDGELPTGSAMSFSYVYTPITLPLLRLLGHLPGRFVPAYWLLYVAGVLVQFWVCMKSGQENERIFLALLAPAAAFFPGLEQSDAILSGNIAYILYGLVLLAALRGWRRNRWIWFYAVVLAASCFKPPYLTLLAIPVLSARRQWLPACAAATAGAGVFALQPILWPAYFSNFLHAVELQFRYNYDFGASPAGVFGLLLHLANIPYAAASWIFYLLYAVPLFLLLVFLSRRYFDGALSPEQWVPVLLCGAILLNPRLIEYDLAPITLPMALIVYRHIASSAHRIWQAAIAISLLATANVLAFAPISASRCARCLILLCVFSVGTWRLFKLQRGPAAHSELR
ncbi:MAG: glycosyltransferase 87 family protein [Terracidiphilus sp.]